MCSDCGIVYAFHVLVDVYILCVCSVFIVVECSLFLICVWVVVVCLLCHADVECWCPNTHTHSVQPVAMCSDMFCVVCSLVMFVVECGCNRWPYSRHIGLATALYAESNVSLSFPHLVEEKTLSIKYSYCPCVAVYFSKCDVVSIGYKLCMFGRSRYVWSVYVEEYGWKKTALWNTCFE